MAEAEGSENTSCLPPVLHVVVVGFHHKRGCQVDFSYPPLIDGQPNNSNELPDEWKHLPFLALPDGAHNYKEDTIYFHLPGKGQCKDTVYGVSCYRQIDTKDLKSQQAEYTRGTVQKSVCVLSTLPLYGLIQAKLKLITHAYFGERDFSQTAILEDLYKSLNLSLHKRLLDDSQVFLGLDLRELVLRFKHKILVIFKLLLLERRVLFYCSPAEKLCASVLSFVSLFPGMIQNGLTEAACYRYYKPTTPSLVLEDFGIDTKEYMNIDMSHVPNYHNRRKKSPFRGTMRTSQTSKVDVTDTTDESSVGTLPTSSPPLQDNVNTNSNGGHNGVINFDRKEEKNMESDLLTSAANVALSRRSIPKEGEENGGIQNVQTRLNSDDNTIPELKGQGSLNNNKWNGDDLMQKNNAERKLSRNTGSKYSKKSSRSSHRQRSAQTKATVNEMDKEEEAYVDYDNISAHSRESVDVNARINAYFDTLVKKHEDSASSSSCSASLNSYDVSSSHDISTSHDDLATSSMLSDTGTSSRLSEWSVITSDVSESSRSLDVTEDSSDKFPTVKVLEDELLEMIDQELYGPYFETKRFSHFTLEKSGNPVRNSLDSTQTMSDDAESNTPVVSARNSSVEDYSGSDPRCSVTDDFVILPSTPGPTELDTDNFGFPLALFGKGALCHPYISLQQHDLLQDVNVRCFVIGASNALFKHQRHLVDVLVEANEGKVLVYDHEVRRQLHLSTADLRFADFLVKNVADEQEDVFLDQTGWEGGDEWIRAQFKVYLLSLLATTAHGNSEQEADFNDSWVRAWKTTHNYRLWKSQAYENIDYIHPGHPFTGGIGVSDMKIKLQSAMQTSDRGKKLNSAISKTSEAVFHTSKAVGGALTSAKSAVSSWFSSFAGGEWKIDEEEVLTKEKEIKKQEEIKKEEEKNGNQDMKQEEKADEKNKDEDERKKDEKQDGVDSEEEQQKKVAMENRENERKKEEDLKLVKEESVEVEEEGKNGEESTQPPETQGPEPEDTVEGDLDKSDLMENMEEQWDVKRSEIEGEKIEGDVEEEEEDGGDAVVANAAAAAAVAAAAAAVANGAAAADDDDDDYL